MTLATLVHDRMSELNLSSRDVHKRGGPHQYTVNQILLGRQKKVQEANARKLAKALQLAETELTRFVTNMGYRRRKKHANPKVSKLMKHRWSKLKEFESKNGDADGRFMLIDTRTGTIVSRFNDRRV